MKYDILEEFRMYVQEHTKSPDTARKYYSAVKNLFSELQFNSLQEIDQEYIKQRLMQVKTKNQFSACKNGLELLKEYDSSFPIPDETFFTDGSRHKRNHRHKAEPIYVSTVKRKVNQIRNKKIKLAYRLGMVSGLRVSELAALKFGDVKFGEDGIITLHVRHGKGNKAGNVTCMKDDYVFRELKAYIQEHGTETEKLFYSAKYMQEKASKLGLECHDFRRMYAHLHKKKLKKEEGMSNLEANKVIQGNLRHSRYKTTKRYLYGKKFIE